MIKITFQKETKEFKEGVTYHDVILSFGIKCTLAVKVGNDLRALTDSPEADETIELVDIFSAKGRNIYKSGLKFLFEVSVKELYPGSDVSFEHSVPLGMLSSIISKKIFTQIDIDKVKQKMLDLVDENILIKKKNTYKKDALKYFNSQKEFEKADNVSNNTDMLFTLYELKGYHNYFYSEMPYSTCCISKFDIINLGNNKLIFILPIPNSTGELPNYVHHAGIIDSFLESEDWIKKQNMRYVTNLNLNVGNGKIKEFMKSNEIVFKLSVFRAASNVIENKKIKFVMIAGPSSSGKTTTTKQLAILLKALGYDPIKISTDDYFVDRDNTPKDKNGEFDFECLEAIDLDYLNEDIRKLLNKEAIKMPVYNFITGKKELGTKNTILKDNSILLVEGLHSLNDNLLPEIDPETKYKIYLSPFMPLAIDRHNYISTIDLRLLRRIVRDNRTRGYGVATTIHNWNVVRNGEEKYIFPYIHQADIIINTALIYEIGVLKVFVEPLLLSIGIDSAYYPEAKRLLCFLKQFFPIPGEYVVADSILREFIGGNND